MNKPAMKSRHPHPFQQGVTLLEVLIAIVVLSFGLLGMLGMLMNGLKMTSSSHYRTIAAQQLTAMADMINANPSLIGTYAHTTPMTRTNVTATCFTTGCSTAQLPPTDYRLWQDNLAALLPSGTGILCLDAIPCRRKFRGFCLRQYRGGPRSRFAGTRMPGSQFPVAA